MDYHGLSTIIMDYQGLSTIIMDYRWLSRIIKDYHGSSRIIIEYQELPRITLNYHRISRYSSHQRGTLVLFRATLKNFQEFWKNDWDSRCWKSQPTFWAGISKIENPIRFSKFLEIFQSGPEKGKGTPLVWGNTQESMIIQGNYQWFSVLARDLGAGSLTITKSWPNYFLYLTQWHRGD